MEYRYDTSLGRISLQISRALGKSFEQKAREQGVALRADQWTLISLLFHKGKLTQKEIADQVYTDKVAVSRLVDRMAGRGMVVRKPASDDKRARQVSLTREGEQLYLRMEPLARQTIAEALEGLDEGAVKRLFGQLDRIMANLRY